MTTNSKDLTKQAPASPRHRTGGYALLARLTDKARADIDGKAGEYHTDCPLDHILLDWKGVKYAPVRKALEDGATDEQIAAHLDANGTPKTPVEVAEWSDGAEKVTMHGDPEKGEWFDGECRKVGLDPATTSVFTWLETTDREDFKA